MANFELISMKQDQENRLIDKKELADFLKVSVRTIEKNASRIAGFRKIGRAVRFYVPEVLKALELGKNIIPPVKKSVR